MKARLVLIPLMVIILFGCDKSNIHKEHYENGQVKFVVPTIDSLYHGEMVYYFPEGQAKGFSTWKHGKLHGPAELLYKNGKVYQKLIFRDGLQADSVIIYREDSSLQEIQYYDSIGRLKDYRKFTKQNVQDTSTTTRQVVIVSDSDSILMSDKFIAYLRIGNLHGQRVEAILGNYYEDSLLYARKPRLPKVNDTTVRIEIIPESLGENIVKGLAIEVFDHPKSLILYPFIDTFYVLDERSQMTKSGSE